MSSLPHLRLDYNAEEIKTITERSLKEALERIQLLEKIPSDQRTFDNTWTVYDAIWCQLAQQLNGIEWLRHVSTNKAVRIAAGNAKVAHSNFVISHKYHEEMYHVLRSVKAPANDEQSQKLYKDILVQFKRNGIALSLQQRTILENKRKSLNQLESDFQQNLRATRDIVYLSEEDMKGMSDSFKERCLSKETGLYAISTDYVDIFPFLTYADNSETRQKVFSMYMQKADALNIPVLQKMVTLRYEIARLLGYDNYTDYSTEMQTCAGKLTINEFLKDLKTSIEPYVTKDKQLLSEAKRESDVSYEKQKYMKQNHDLDMEKISEYLPLDHVMPAMFSIFEEVFGLKISEEPLPQHYVYAPGVKGIHYFSVCDEESKKVLGHFIIDLYPRDNKYSHAAEEDLHPVVQGSGQLPLCGLIVNFTPPTDTRPSLLTLKETTTFFHEFGHVLHGILGTLQANYYQFTGTHVETDFVEVPSQMLENWINDPIVLRRITQHYETKETLPVEWMEKIYKTRSQFEALARQRQLLYAFADLELYQSPEPLSEEEIRAIIPRLHKELSWPVGDKDSLYGGWTHMTGQYSSRYYSYTVSSIISHNLYALFRHNPLNKENGWHYRKTILEKGGSRTSTQMIRDFLGTDWNVKPYIEFIQG